MFRDAILSLLGKPTRLDTARKHISLATLRLPHKVGSWKCICGHVNSVYYLFSHAHPLGILACAREDCGLTWHPSTNPITPHHRSDLLVQVRLPDPKRPSDGQAPYILPRPTQTVLTKVAPNAGPEGYGYVCLNEGCGLSWATEVVREWPWGGGRKVMAIGGRRWKGLCLCGKQLQVGGGFAVFEVLRRFEEEI